MRVILKTDVENLGDFGAVVKVAPGYARNFLIPKGLASEATEGNLKQFEAERGAFLKKAEDRKKKAEGLKAGLDAVSLSFSRKTSEEDKLFGSVTVHDIEEALKAKGFTVEKGQIQLHEPIKALGASTVAVKLHPQVVASITVEVVKE